MPVPVILALILLALAAFWLLATAPRRRPPELFAQLRQWHYAHRGLHDALAQENSLSAFRRAFAAGFGAELDVHLLRDGQLAVMHDESLQRMCTAQALLCDLTKEQLAQYRLPGGARIPLLGDVLQACDGRAPLIIELKTHAGNHAALCQAVCDALEGYAGPYCLESFDPRVLLWLRRNRPQLVRGQLSEHFRRHGTRLAPPLDFAIRNLLTNFLTRPDFFAYRWEDRDRPGFRLLRRLHPGREFSWTVRERAVQQRVQATGAVIIFEGFDPEPDEAE